MILLSFILAAVSSLGGLENEPNLASMHSSPTYRPPGPQIATDAAWYDTLEQKGVKLASSYYLELAANPVGGREQGFGNAAWLGAALGLDLDKLANIHGLDFFTSASFRSGVNLSARKIDNQFEVTELYGGETVRLTELYLRETLFDNHFHIKAGRLTAGNDFLASPFYLEFVNLAFCGNPISLLFNTPYLDYPFSTWGAYLDFLPHSDLLVKFAVYNGNANIKENKYHGCNFTFDSPQGVMWMTEWTYFLNQSHESKGYPGNYKLGGYFINRGTPIFEGGDGRNYGYYFLFDQMIYRKGGPKTTQGLTAFGTFLFAPSDRNMFPVFLSGGFIYKGCIPSRDHDYLTFGAAYGAYSEDLRKVQHQAQMTHTMSAFGSQPQHFETILELSYWCRIKKWLFVTPDIQYVINPKGYGTIPNAFVVALQISIDLIGLQKRP